MIADTTKVFHVKISATEKRLTHAFFLVPHLEIHTFLMSAARFKVGVEIVYRKDWARGGTDRTIDIPDPS